MGVSIDSINEYIYTAAYGDVLYRAKLDGSSGEIPFPHGKKETFCSYKSGRLCSFGWFYGVYSL